MHAIMKNDLAGGHLPSAHFGANATWWAIMILAFNLNSLMKHLALPEGWESKRLKAVRFGFINLAGRSSESLPATNNPSEWQSSSLCHTARGAPAIEALWMATESTVLALDPP